jgi:hypothetical protein
LEAGLTTRVTIGKAVMLERRQLWEDLIRVGDGGPEMRIETAVLCKESTASSKQDAEPLSVQGLKEISEAF